MSSWLDFLPGLRDSRCCSVASLGTLGAAPTPLEGDAQVDDVLDAALDDDGMDATRL
jgi:hypothetical protein